jgi:hypothetical protein
MVLLIVVGGLGLSIVAYLITGGAGLVPVGG